ncbi:MAG: hypothetical protein K9L21_04860 [Spirochaetia bacterium]|nr:hypothetical protein [Spirochaetia bacterium]
MKRITGIALVIMIFAAVSASAAAKKIAIVYFERSEVNMEGMDFISKEIRKQRLPFTISYARGFDALKGNESAIVIFNTGLKSGMNTVAESYLANVPDKDKLVVINLYAVGKNIMYDRTLPEDSVYGVDEISAATWYDDGRNSKSVAMHHQWVDELFLLLQEK